MINKIEQKEWRKMGWGEGGGGGGGGGWVSKFPPPPLPTYPHTTHTG